MTPRDKKALMEKWIGFYEDRLRPKLVLGSYIIAPSVEADITDRMNNLFKHQKNAWAAGGGLAADLLIHYYRGPSTEVYIRPDFFNEVKSGLRLLPAKESNITLFNLFSPLVIYNTGTPVPVAHPLLIYAELLVQGTSRSRETAELIYNNYLRQLIDEN